MKNKSKIYLIVFLILSLFLVACEKTQDEDVMSEKIILKEASNITETSFDINWTANVSGITSFVLELGETYPWRNPIIIELNPFLNTYNIDQLNGASSYCYRLKADFSDGTSFTTPIKSTSTLFTTEVVNISTEDGLNLSGKLYYLDYMTNAEPVPGVIFMHELGVFVNNWKSSMVVKSLMREGYVCLVFDFRGHGQSTPIEDLMTLVNDLSLVAMDLTAAVEFMKDIERVHQDSLALVGASLGGIMAIAGNGFEEVISSVAISAPQNGIYELFPEMTIKNVFYIAGENDFNPNTNTDFAADAQAMYDDSENPKKIIIVNGTAAHATELFMKDTLLFEIEDWVISGFENK